MFFGKVQKIHKIQGKSINYKEKSGY